MQASIVKRKTIKNFKFPAPTQLLMNGQWWSNTLTQHPQESQCLLLFGFSILIVRIN
jgi:hypothetical protein